MSKPTKKEKLDALAHKDISENNWENPEDEDGRMKKEEGSFENKPVEIPDELKDVFNILSANIPVIEDIKKKIIDAWLKVDPEIRNGNPVWKYSVNKNLFVFVFKDGRKVRISLSSEEA